MSKISKQNSNNIKDNKNKINRASLLRAEARLAAAHDLRQLNQMHSGRKSARNSTRNASRVTPGQRIERTGLLTARNAPMKNKPMILDEDEYIADVNGSVGFIATAYPCNPGQSAVFPWGSRIAQLYEEYDFEKLEFYITSEVSGYATQGQTGVVILSFDYDASDPLPTTKQQVEATKPHTVPALPSTSVICLSVDCATLRKGDGKYVRPGAQPASTDIKTYDCGNLNVSTQGQANASAFGELHVRYRCALREQVLEPAVVVGGAVHFSSIAATTANLFAAASLQAGGSPSLTGITVSTANTLTFPAGIPGNYLVVLSAMGATSCGAIVTASATCTAVALLTQGAVRDDIGAVASLPGTTTNYAMYTGAWTVPTGGGNVVWTAPTIVGTGSMDLFVISLPSSVITITEDEKKIIALEQRLQRMEQFFVDEERKVFEVRPLTLPQTPLSDVEMVEVQENSLTKSIHIPRSFLSQFSRS
jgi:hypothetical protein